MKESYIWWSAIIAVVSVVIGVGLVIAGAGFSTTLVGLILISSGPFHWWVAGQMDELSRMRQIDRRTEDDYS
jgi:predicted cobalt transporter CbtA